MCGLLLSHVASPHLVLIKSRILRTETSVM